MLALARNLMTYTSVLHPLSKVGSGLQVQGCRPHLMKASLVTLEAIMESTLPESFTLDLLPRVPACSLACKCGASASSGASHLQHA